MKTEALSDQKLVEFILAGSPGQTVIDEYYRRCIPLYLDFIGSHWHTGFYADNNQDIHPDDQLQMIRVIADSVSLSHQDSVLDVGCGIGSTACFLAKEYAVRVHGLTPVKQQQQLSSRLIQKLGLAQQVKIDIGHAGCLPYPDQYFDVLVFFESPCHFPDRQAFFNEAYRVLKPGGRLAGEDWLKRAGMLDTQGAALIQSVCREWAIPALGDADSYTQQMQRAGFTDIGYHDLQTESNLNKGFSVTTKQQQDLSEEIIACDQALLKLSLQGLRSLGKARAANVFTIGRFYAHKAEHSEK